MNYYLDISDSHLLYIAENTLGLETLILQGASRITAIGIGLSVYYWKNLKCLSLGPLQMKSISAILYITGKHCQSREKWCSSCQVSAPSGGTIELEAATLHKGGLTFKDYMGTGLQCILLTKCYLAVLPTYSKFPVTFWLELDNAGEGFRKWHVKSAHPKWFVSIMTCFWKHYTEKEYYAISVFSSWLLGMW